MKVNTAAELMFFMTLRIETKESIGTGFIFEHKWNCPKTGAELTGIFLVTNKHVVENSERGTLRFTLRSEDNTSPNLGDCTDVNVTRREWGWWGGHPDANVDVAVFPLNPLLDRVAETGLKAIFLLCRCATTSRKQPVRRPERN